MWFVTTIQTEVVEERSVDDSVFYFVKYYKMKAMDLIWSVS